MAAHESAPTPTPLPKESAHGAYLADPAPLGLAGFAATTFFLSVVNTNMLGSFATSTVLSLALAYGGLAQLLAGMWEFAKGNTFGATAFSSYGAFWISFWYLQDHILPGQVKEIKTPQNLYDILHGAGLYLLVWGIFTAYMTVAASRVSGAVFVVFVLLTVTYLILAIGFFAESGTEFEKNNNFFINLGGWLGLLTALAAWYASFAGVVAFTFKRAVLPTYPR
jgi:succinate-acetate transporter protein